MNSHGLEERPNCVIKDRSLLWLVDVLVAQEVHKVARIHSVESIKEHVETILKVNQFAILHAEWMKCPTGEIIKDVKQVGKEGAD